MADPAKSVVVSVGPIPARVDSVKFITNRFKGGLALKTVKRLLDEPGISVTIVAWHYTDIPYEIEHRCANVFRVKDVFEYYDWFVANAKNYSAFVMAAAVANLTPVKPYTGKFPSHLYKPGDEFDIRFMIAPRAIDAIKELNPKACLIGYKLFDAPDDKAMIEIATRTLKDSRANLVFANTPKDAKTRKLALTQDGSVIPCTFDEHCDLIVRAIKQKYYRSKIEPMTDEEAGDVDIREALATVESFENSFEKYGTVAVAVNDRPGLFATTSRGHKDGPVLVRAIDHENCVVHASGKATLNAPALAALLEKSMERDPVASVVVHRHIKMPDEEVDALAVTTPDGDPVIVVRPADNRPAMYVFPGTVDEVQYVKNAADGTDTGIYEPYHGYLLPRTVGPVDWSKYYEQFPSRYFTVPEAIQSVLETSAGKTTLELGGNVNSGAKYVYDPNVTSETAESLTLSQIQDMRFDLGYALNAVNYLSKYTLRLILARCDAFVANTFFKAPEKSVRGREAAILDRDENQVRHTLRLSDDSVVRHAFYAYDPSDYEELGLKVLRYGKNSALVYKGLDLE